MRLLSTRSLAIAAVICALLALLIVVLCNVPLPFDKVPSAHTVSRSARESKARGLWIASFVASPAELNTPRQTVHIAAAWLESRSHRTETLSGTRTVARFTRPTFASLPISRTSDLAWYHPGMIHVQRISASSPRRKRPNKLLEPTAGRCHDQI